MQAKTKGGMSSQCGFPYSVDNGTVCLHLLDGPKETGWGGGMSLFLYFRYLNILPLPKSPRGKCQLDSTGVIL